MHEVSHFEIPGARVSAPCREAHIAMGLDLGKCARHIIRAGCDAGGTLSIPFDGSGWVSNMAQFNCL
jgi:hypothetical protein